MKRMFGVVLLSLVTLGGCKNETASDAEAQEAPPKKKKPKPVKAEPVLPRIAKFEPPANDGIGDIYDSSPERKPMEVLVWDVFQRLKMDLKISELSPAKVEVADVEKAIAIYMDRDWRKIAGYRPHGNWAFIRSLTDDERKQLAADVLDHARKNDLFKPL